MDDAQQQKMLSTPGLACWYEIPVTDLDKSQKFYEAVLGITMIKQEGDGEPNPMVWFNDPSNTGSFGHLYPGKPSASGTGNTIHMLSTAPLEEAIKRVETAGGKVASPIVPIPAGRFVYIEDLDGNSIGLFNWA